MLKAEKNCVTLLCFCPPGNFEQRLQMIKNNKEWKNAFEDPYELFLIVLDELLMEMNETIKNLSKAFGGMEWVCIIYLEDHNAVAEY